MLAQFFFVIWVNSSLTFDSLMLKQHLVFKTWCLGINMLTPMAEIYSNRMLLVCYRSLKNDMFDCLLDKGNGAWKIANHSIEIL